MTQASSASQPGQAKTDPSSEAKSQAEIRRLEAAGKPIDRELRGGEAHSYEIALTAGQYLNVVVDQRGIDVVVAVIGPDGKQIMEVDTPNGTQGPEPVALVAEASGSYRLNVRSLEKEASPGRYQIRVVEVRAATENDRALQDAVKLITEIRRLKEKGQYDAGLPLAERALELREKVLGPEHPDVATALDELGQILHRKGEYARAEPPYQRALAIREKALGLEHPDVAESLNNLAFLYYERGDYGKAEPLYQRALAILEKTLGAEHPDISFPLNNLALVYDSTGDYAKAEQLFQRSLAIRDKSFGADHPNVATALNNLAGIYHRKGDYAKAEPLFQRALAIREKAFGPQHPAVAQSLNNLAVLYKVQGDYARAEPLYERALAVNEKTLGSQHPEVATSLDSLARLHHTKGDYAKAEPLYQRAMAIREKTIGVQHPLYAESLNNLAGLYKDQKEYAKAEPLNQRALATWEKALGNGHPRVAFSLNNLAVLYQAMGDTPRAIECRVRGNEISERNIALNIATGSERQKLVYLATLLPETDGTIALHVQSASNDPAARQLALLTVLRRKGRALDAMTDSIAALRRRLSPQDRALLDQLTEARSRIATLVLRGPRRTDRAQHQAEIKKREEQIEKLEADISLRSAEFRAQSKPVTLEAVQSAIPREAALVEFVSYRPFNFNYKKSDEAFGEARYVAYVLRNQSEATWVELGEAKVIDRDIERLRKALRDPKRGDMKQLARTVDEKVMRPVRNLLGKTRRVLLSPDGALNLIPFAALVDENNRYLVKRFSFTYLTTGRDLLRLQTRTQSTQRATVLADPDFGERPADSSDRKLKISPIAVDFSEVYFSPLPGTAEEAQALNGILSDATILTRGQATEAALKQVAGPSILHVATHGFFLEDVMNREDASRGLVISSQQSGDRAPRIENPLLRSGLGLAGANLHKSGDDDGVLTALEAAGLDLWGTKLVVLSACDTGVGEVKNGDGVYGLRRALVLAGSESQVMSLWSVSDTATRDLMIDYYTRLQGGEGRGEALRQVQLKMLASKNSQHPYYWASFIQSGEWANLDGKR